MARPHLAAEARRRSAGLVLVLPLCAQGVAPAGRERGADRGGGGRARRQGAPALEAYPFDAAVSPSATGTGYASTFARAGFETVARRTPARPIMRHDLKAGAEGGRYSHLIVPGGLLVKS